ncbi:MAG TPA: hypothetical protein PLP14_07480 [Chitinophagaceae bacterium]|nr:hypothetical protein [Chitinophagaceae bacterium]
MSNLLPAELWSTIPNLSPDQWHQLEEAHQQPPVVSVRINPDKNSHAFDSFTPVPWCTYGYYLPERPSFTYDPLFHCGTYYVQEASSMFLSYALKQVIQFDDDILALDLSAAPGGKTTLVSSLMNDRSLLIANEVISSRAGILAENTIKWGRINTWVSQSDPRQFGALRETFDLVLMDMPCSGSGLFRKKTGYRDEWNPDLVRHCAERQKRILHDSLESLKPGGILMYMTCSFSAEENEDIGDYILQHFPMKPVHIEVPAEWNIVCSQTVTGTRGYRFFPGNIRGEGFYLSCFRKEGDSVTGFTTGEGLQKSNKGIHLLSSWTDTIQLCTTEYKDQLIMMHIAHAGLRDQFPGVRFLRKGILAGKLVRDELIPAHELAMYSSLVSKRPFVDLSEEQALAFLRKQSIELPDAPHGWVLAMYKGMALGWIKNLGKRSNNYYPSAYRILN